MKAVLDPGEVVGGRYRIVRRLGMGGMGAVYLANVEGMAGFEKRVALKVAHGHVSHDKHVMEMFLAEARLSAQLQHANLGQVHDLGQMGELFFIAMEYIDGVDLRALINALAEKRARLPVPIVIAIVCRLLEGLDYAHALRDKSGKPLKLVHRDVSPVNCLISYTGDVKLIDFGIAKAADQVGRTKTGMVRGKLNYMSPEQARGEPLDRRSDVFAVGVILYELLVGVRPFDALADLDVMDNIVEGRLTPPRALDDAITPQLEAVTLKALAADRTERFETAGQMQEALERVLLAMQVRVGARELAAFLGVVCPRPEAGAPGEVTGETRPRADPLPDPSVMQTRSMPAAAAAAAATVVGRPPVAVGDLPEATDASAMALTPKVADEQQATVTAPLPRAGFRWLGVAAVAVGAGIGATAWFVTRPEPVAEPVPIARPVTVAPVPAPPPEKHDEPPPVPVPAPPAPAPPPVKGPVRKSAPAPHLAPLKAYVAVHASGPVELFVDGASAGSATPHTVSAGKHTLRADCLYVGGRKTALTQTVTLPPEQDFDLNVDCPSQP